MVHPTVSTVMGARMCKSESASAAGTSWGYDDAGKASGGYMVVAWGTWWGHAEAAKQNEEGGGVKGLWRKWVK